MLTIVIVMLFTLLVGGVVLVYVAFPHRGEDVPLVPQAGKVMRRGVDSLPTLEDHEREPWLTSGR